MRLKWPRWGNPWPHDMVIRVEDHPVALNLLLFVRRSWSLAADLDIPELQPAPERGSSARPESASVAEWEYRWRTAWNRAWRWYDIKDSDPTHLPTPEIIREVSRPGQDLHPLIPPLWTADYGQEGLDWDAFSEWDRALTPHFPSYAERLCLPDLIDAWRSGMENVIVLPYAGYFAQRVSRSYLAVSAVTRNAPEDYCKALQVRM